MTMNDDFLHHIRAEPPPRFIASLKARLDHLEVAPLTRRPVRRRIFFVAGMLSGAALATGLFVSRSMYSPPSDNLPAIPPAKPSLAENQHAGPAPRATDSTTAAVAMPPQGKAAGSIRE